MTAPIFVDTNVFIYALDSSDISKQRVAQIWLNALWNSRTGRISFQVLQELYVKIVYRMPTARDRARAEIRDLLAWRPISTSANTLEQAWKIQDRYRFSFWDALIVAAATEAGCEYLLTEDLQSGQTLEGMKVINPFALAPAAIGLTGPPE
jgi:predicted nucleic acid-binding protein